MSNKNIESYQTLKRVLDVGLSALALVTLSPLIALTALAIKIEDGGPILFRQQRIGQYGRPFRILKFRSMPVAAPQLESSQSTGLRVTQVGRWIRRTNIDELPQLVNILAGDMSIVGPRPALSTQKSLIKLRETNQSLLLRPGLTGLAQINSYDGMSPEDKARLDGEYLERYGLASDLKIIVGTILYLAKPPPTY